MSWAIYSFNEIKKKYRHQKNVIYIIYFVKHVSDSVKILTIFNLFQLNILF